MQKICVVTSTRAEYGLLKPLMWRIKKNPSLKLQIVATGTHLEEKYGNTVTEIEKDGFLIDRKVPIVCGDTPLAVIETMGKALIGIGRFFEELSPNMVVILGDRYEMPPVAEAAVVQGIPVAHINGGEVTEGAYDEMFRHALTKLSHLHFTSTEEYRCRVIQMGEDPNRVFNVGSLGVENILNLKLYSKEDLTRELLFEIDEKTLLVTFHPVTMEVALQEEQFKTLLDAFDERPQFKVIFTRPNADTGRDKLDTMLDRYVENRHNRCIVFDSLGAVKYLSTMKYCAGVVGNSSSGIIEAPSMHIGTVNIGNRQKGRIRAESVIDCAPNLQDIVSALDQLIDPSFRKALKNIKNPYEGDCPSARITEEICKYFESDYRLGKKFYDIQFNLRKV